MAKIATPRVAKNGAVKRTSQETPVSRETAEIQALAYQFFVDRGYEHGHDQEDWARAEAIVKNRKRN